MFRREDVPLVVMTLVSLAILLVFVASSFAMVPAPRQLGCCDHPVHAATSPEWSHVASYLRAVEPCIPTLAAKPPSGPGQPRNAESARRALVTPTGVDC
jgi:hypothetical protein